MKQEAQDIIAETIRATPGIAMTGLTLNHWVGIATICFIVLQAVYLIRKWVREETAWGRKIARWSRENLTTQPGDLM